jgi:hypothetical protein
VSIHPSLERLKTLAHNTFEIKSMDKTVTDGLSTEYALNAVNQGVTALGIKG